MNVVISIFGLGGHPLTQVMLFAGLLNSFVAMAIVWFVLVRPFVVRAKRKTSTG